MKESNSRGRKVVEDKEKNVLYVEGSNLKEVRENIKNYLIEKGYSREEAETKVREARFLLGEPVSNIYRPEKEGAEEPLSIKCSCGGEILKGMKKYLQQKYNVGNT